MSHFITTTGKYLKLVNLDSVKLIPAANMEFNYEGVVDNISKLDGGDVYFVEDAEGGGPGELIDSSTEQVFETGDIVGTPLEKLCTQLHNAGHIIRIWWQDNDVLAYSYVINCYSIVTLISTISECPSTINLRLIPQNVRQTNLRMWDLVEGKVQANYWMKPISFRQNNYSPADRYEINLNRDEFLEALKKGLGRSFLHVKFNGDCKIRDSILFCCLNDTTYHRQFEGDRSEWLISLIDLTGFGNYYASAIINALMSSTDFDNAQQLLNLCAILAKRGNKDAIEVIYKKFDLQEFFESYMGGYQIIDIDGLAGLKHVIQRIGRRLIEEDDYWEDGGLLYYANDVLGKDKVDAYCKTISSTDRNIKAYFDGLESIRKLRSKQKKSTRTERIREIFPLKRIIKAVKKKKWSYPYRYQLFGKFAKEDDILIVFEKFLEETRKGRLIRYLWIFRNKKFPRLEEKLFQLAGSSNRKLCIAAVESLRLCRDTRINDLAVELTKNTNKYVAFSSISLFINNYKSGDNNVIESVLARVNGKDDTHIVCEDLINVIAKNPTKELLACLLWSYEETSYTPYRQRIVEALIKNDLIPKGLLDECLFDCVEEIRNLVTEHQKKLMI